VHCSALCCWATRCSAEHTWRCYILGNAAHADINCQLQFIYSAMYGCIHPAGSASRLVHLAKDAMHLRRLADVLSAIAQCI
jgi:hypothetical protein